jgi:transcriptional regulator with XRE-family HTH domain
MGLARFAWLYRGQDRRYLAAGTGRSRLDPEEVAQRLLTKKSAISRIENHADDVRLSTLRRCAEAVGAHLQINLA